MLFYLISLAFLVFVFFSSFGEKTTKAKVLNAIGIIVGIITIYYIFADELTDSVIINILLSAPLALGVLLSLLDVTDKKDRKQQSVQPNQQTAVNMNINNNLPVSPTYNTPTTTYNTAPVQPNIPLPQEEEEINIVEYDNITSAAGIAKAKGTQEAFSIAVYRNNIRYVFNIVDGQMVSYKTPNMTSEKKYEGIG
jgi:hypothetical protein